jgi:hypothetical protein
VQTEAADEERIFNVLREAEPILLAEISAMVPSILGSLFRLERIEVRRGSVELWVVVAGGFTLVSQYADFVRSLELLHSQIIGFIRQLLAGQNVPQVTITGGWTSITTGRGRPFPPLSFRISQELILLMLILYLKLEWRRYSSC